MNALFVYTCPAIGGRPKGCTTTILTGGFVGGPASDLGHHKAGNLRGELEQVRELLHHAAGRRVAEYLRADTRKKNKNT